MKNKKEKNVILVCKEDGQVIEDIMIHNHKCEYRSMCAGCENLINEEDYFEPLCDLSEENLIIDFDRYDCDSYHERDSQAVVHLFLSTEIDVDCEYKDDDKCKYKGCCKFKIEDY